MISLEHPGDDGLPSRIVQRFLLAAQNGEYQAADRLPSERELAGELGVSRNTVTAAYAKLEQIGMIRRIHGKGAFLCAPPVDKASLCWSGKISRFTDSLDEPVLEMLARSSAGRVPFPLSAGTPSLEILSKEMYKNCVTGVIDETFPHALAVASTEGQWELREAIGAWTGCQPHNVLITAGRTGGYRPNRKVFGRARGLRRCGFTQLPGRPPKLPFRGRAFAPVDHDVVAEST